MILNYANDSFFKHLVGWANYLLTVSVSVQHINSNKTLTTTIKKNRNSDDRIRKQTHRFVSVEMSELVFLFVKFQIGSNNKCVCVSVEDLEKLNGKFFLCEWCSVAIKIGSSRRPIIVKSYYYLRCFLPDASL